MSIAAAEESARVQQCRTALKSLWGQVEDRATHWKDLGKAVRDAYGFSTAHAESTDPEESRAAMRAIEVLAPLQQADPLSADELHTLLPRTPELLSAARLLKDADRAGSLWLALHSTIDQHIELAASGIESLTVSLQEVVHNLKALNDAELLSLTSRIETALGACSDVMTLANLQELASSLQDTWQALPAPRPPRRTSSPPVWKTRRFRIAHVEDNPAWESFVTRAIDAVRETLGPEFTLETVRYDNKDDALAGLRPRMETPVQAAQARDQDRVQTILIADMGLPENAAHARAICEKKSTPSRENGHALLAELRAYRANIPTIVFTTPPELLDDQLRVCALGIADAHYILKGVDPQERLVEAVLDIIRRSDTHRIELSMERKEASIDGVPVPLSEGLFHLLYALAELSAESPGVFTPREILDRIHRMFTRRYDFLHSPKSAWEWARELARLRGQNRWTPLQEKYAAHAVLRWAECRRDCHGDLLAALGKMRSESWGLFREACEAFEAWRRLEPEASAWSASGDCPVARLDAGLLAAGFDQLFSGLEVWQQAARLASERVKDGWQEEWLEGAAFIIGYWWEYKREAEGDLQRALELLHRRDRSAWEDAQVLLSKPPSQAAGGAQQELAARFDAAFGLPQAPAALELPPEYDVKNIERQMYPLRNAVHAAFQRVHRTIEPREEVIRQEVRGDVSGYRVVGEIVLDEDADTEYEEDAEKRYEGGVLVVENEPAYRRRIEQLLQDAGYRVRVVTNAADALEEALGPDLPEILSLDLHIPATREDWERDPSSGSEENGLRVWQRVHEAKPQIRVVVPTTLSDQDRLRERLIAEGVPLDNFVPKGVSTDGAAWEGHLLLTISRLYREIWSRAVLPALPPWRLPVVRVLPGSDLATGSLHLLVNGRESIFRRNQGRLLAPFLHRPEEVLTYEEVERPIYGRAATEDERKGLLKNVRAKIAEEWLDPVQRPAKGAGVEILEAVEGGLILHAHVESATPSAESEGGREKRKRKHETR